MAVGESGEGAESDVPCQRGDAAGRAPETEWKESHGCRRGEKGRIRGETGRKSERPNG